MTELNEEQQKLVDHQKLPRVLDPRTSKTYVLVQTDVFDKVKQVLGIDDEQDWVEDTLPSAMKVFAEGWDDPSMDIYDQLDPRGK